MVYIPMVTFIKGYFILYEGRLVQKGRIYINLPRNTIHYTNLVRAYFYVKVGENFVSTTRRFNEYIILIRLYLKCVKLYLTACNIVK